MAKEGPRPGWISGKKKPKLHQTVLAQAFHAVSVRRRSLAGTAVTQMQQPLTSFFKRRVPSSPAADKANDSEAEDLVVLLSHNEYSNASHESMGEQIQIDQEEPEEDTSECDVSTSARATDKFSRKIVTEVAETAVCPQFFDENETVEEDLEDAISDGDDAENTISDSDSNATVALSDTFSMLSSNECSFTAESDGLDPADDNSIIASFATPFFPSLPSPPSLGSYVMDVSLSIPT
ncbi:hypothetical protein DFJ77DRAFT_511448 [Powellomyces hirtus]|nr:hypothetical protein DFJ77DRAFT_511448 [Powellomyces hirtus]